MYHFFRFHISDIIYLSFEWWVILHRIYNTTFFFIYFFCWWAFWFLSCSGYCKCAAVNIRVYVSFQILIFFGNTSRSGIAGSYGSYIFSFLRNFHTVLHGDCSNLHSHPQSRWVPFLQTLSRLFLFVYSLMMVILTGMRWYLIAVLIFVFL